MSVITHNVTDPLKTLIPDGPCRNNVGWSKHCEILKPHCWDFLSMKKHCTMTCEFCKVGSICKDQECEMPDGTPATNTSPNSNMTQTTPQRQPQPQPQPQDQP